MPVDWRGSLQISFLALGEAVEASCQEYQELQALVEAAVEVVDRPKIQEVAGEVVEEVVAH